MNKVVSLQLEKPNGVQKPVISIQPVEDFATTTMPAIDIKLYVNWEKIKCYELSFDLNGSNGITLDSQFTEINRKQLSQESSRPNKRRL